MESRNNKNYPTVEPRLELGALRVQITFISANWFLVDVRYWHGAVNINVGVTYMPIVTFSACGG
jgi:hypothetical protein